MKVDAPRRDDARAWIGSAERQGESGHRHRVRIVRVNDLRLPVADDARQLPRRRQVNFVARRQRHQVGAFRRAPIELSLRVGDEHGLVPDRAEPENGQEDLVLSAAPGPGGVDVEGEHSSHSFANLRPT